MLYSLRKIGIIYWLALLTNCLTFAQTNDSIDYYNPMRLQYDNAVYQSNIKTISLHRHNEALSIPIIPLNGGIQLALSFDELGDENDNYSYTLIHCTANWEASDIDPFDYIDGFTRYDISDYEYSVNTTQTYTHYRLLFPNNEMRLTKSGNYLLKVYRNDDEEALVLTRRFMVYENKLLIESRLMSANAHNFTRTHHRIDFSIGYNGMPIVNPLAELQVIILQNGRWDNALRDIEPTFLKNKVAIYSSNTIAFEAGNEFRFFDCRSFQQRSERVRKIIESDSNHVYLAPDISRKKTANNHMMRVNFIDKNGQFFIGNADASLFKVIDSDYALVHFSLNRQSPIKNGNIYVFGALSNWQLQDDFQMKYVPQNQAYEAQIYLKQGHYDYLYAATLDGTTNIDTERFEGNYLHTENDYYILVYHKVFSDRYDRLIGVQHINSDR